jgi:Uma2 family endonuclease
MTTVVPQIEIHAVVLRLKPVITLTDDQLFELCQLNRDWRIEYTAEGKLIVMPPTGGGNRRPKCRDFLPIAMVGKR